MIHGKKRSDAEFLDGKRSEKDRDQLRFRNGFYGAPFGFSLALALVGHMGLMMDFWRSAIRQQFHAAIDMLANAIKACPDSVWSRPRLPRLVSLLGR